MWDVLIALHPCVSHAFLACAAWSRRSLSVPHFQCCCPLFLSPSVHAALNVGRDWLHTAHPRPLSRSFRWCAALCAAARDGDRHVQPVVVLGRHGWRFRHLGRLHHRPPHPPADHLHQCVPRHTAPRRAPVGPLAHRGCCAGDHTDGESFNIPWYVLLVLFDLPFIAYYGVFLPYMGYAARLEKTALPPGADGPLPCSPPDPIPHPALTVPCPARHPTQPRPHPSLALFANPRAVEYRPTMQACLYTSRAWVALDFVILLWVFALMLFLVFLLRNVRGRARGQGQESGTARLS